MFFYVSYEHNHLTYFFLFKLYLHIYRRLTNIRALLFYNMYVYICVYIFIYIYIHTYRYISICIDSATCITCTKKRSFLFYISQILYLPHNIYFFFIWYLYLHCATMKKLLSSWSMIYEYTLYIYIYKQW